MKRRARNERDVFGTARWSDNPVEVPSVVEEMVERNSVAHSILALEVSVRP